MSNSERLSDWIERLKQGDAEAAEVIWQHCFERLKEVAKQRLGPTGQRGADEEDIALSAMNSFMTRCREGKFERLRGREELWKLLFTITVRKAYQHIRKQMAAKRLPEIGEYQLRSPGPNAVDRAVLENVADQHAQPADVLLETLEQQDAFNQSLQMLEEPLRLIAIGRLSGQTNDELAEELGCSVRTIERKLHLIRKIWSDAND